MEPIEAPTPPGSAERALEVAARSVLGGVPYIGTAAVELFQAAVTRGREVRMQRWIEAVTDALNEHVLGPRELDFDSLAENNGFLDVIGTATRAAIETSDAEKITALRNAVVNAAEAPDAARDQQTILMGVLAELTPTHVKLLKLFDDPVGWLEAAGIARGDVYSGGAQIVVELAYPDLASNRTLLDRVVGDLKRDGLSEIPLRTMMTASGVYTPRTLPLGRALLDFISLEP